MADIRDLAERLWAGNLTSGEAHPVTAQFREGDEILPGVLFYKGFARGQGRCDVHNVDMTALNGDIG